MPVRMARARARALDPCAVQNRKNHMMQPSMDHKRRTTHSNTMVAKRAHRVMMQKGTTPVGPSSWDIVERGTNTDAGMGERPPDERVQGLAFDVVSLSTLVMKVSRR